MLGRVVRPEALRQFQAQRPRLFAVAYRLLGSAGEAEDVIQDAFFVSMKRTTPRSTTPRPG